jgi:hypothetical protein
MEKLNANTVADLLKIALGQNAHQSLIPPCRAPTPAHAFRGPCVWNPTMTPTTRPNH